MSIEWSDLPGEQVRPENRELLEVLGRCRKVQKRVLGGEGLTRAGGDGFGSSLDAELGFRERGFLILSLCVGKIK